MDIQQHYMLSLKMFWAYTILNRSQVLTKLHFVFVGCIINKNNCNIILYLSTNLILKVINNYNVHKIMLMWLIWSTIQVIKINN